MKYYKWQLFWEINPDTDKEEGFDPVSVINNDNTRIESVFADGDVTKKETWIYAQMSEGNLNLSKLNKWKITEVTAEEILNKACKIDSNATITENGEIKFSADNNIAS